jgi:hypothetical protein
MAHTPASAVRYKSSSANPSTNNFSSAKGSGSSSPRWSQSSRKCSSSRSRSVVMLACQGAERL